MKTIALILLSLLVAWWGVLTIWLVSCHRDRIRAAATPMTAEELEECRKHEASIPRYRMRPKDWVIATPYLIPFAFFFLPIYLYGWLVKEPYMK